MSEQKTTKVTIADVARVAGVSMSSVSNVLNGRTDRMRASTSDRILQAINMLGYTPNLAARQLKTGHSSFIGLIVPSVANPFFGNFARFVEETSLERGYQVMVGNSRRIPELEKKYADQLWGAGVGGIIIGTSLKNLSHFQSLIDSGMHFVAFDRPGSEGDTSAFDSICVDNRQTIKLLVKHLTALKHERIGFISGPIKTVSRQFRLKAFYDCLGEVGLEFDRTLLWEGGANGFGDVTAVELGRQGAHHLLSLTNPPTAIITINDMYAFGVYAGARDLGVKIPDDVSIVGIDNLPLAEVVEPPLTTIEQPLLEMARLAVDRLLGRLRGIYDDSIEHQILQPKLIVRGSTTLCK